MLQFVRFTLVAILLNALDTTWHTTNPSPSDSDNDSSICTTWPVMCYCSDKERTVEVKLKIDISMNLMKKFLQQNRGHLPLIHYYTNHNSEHLYAFLCSH